YRDYVGDIHDSGTHLLEVINDILDISKIEAGKLELKEEHVSINEILTKSVRLMKERAENAGLDITINIEPDLPLLFADARLIKQNLINLLSNAIKFTPEGGHITVRAMVDDNGAITIGVSDTGIGIAAEDLDHVLAPFGQVDSSLSRKYEGTGLGLPLVKSFIELHGGTLTIDSTIGLGTTVTIRFPASRAVGSGTVFKAANQ
ncbi:MAG: HAMP domain-containing sensor histidine kinase, partial [Alphaproteobacteria bacterium]